MVIQCHTLNLIGVGLIKKTELLHKFPAGYIKLLNHVIVCSIKDLANIQQICI